MGILEGAIISRPDIIANFAGIFAPLVTKNITKAVSLQSSMWGYKARCKSLVQIGRKYLQPCSEKHWRIHCSFSSSSDGDGRMAGNFNANDEEYVNSTVIEAVQVRSGSDGFMIKMRDGKFLRCIHNNPQEWNLPDYAPQPAIVLKMEDGSGLLLPIIVLEMPSVLLMAAVRNVQIARPTIYQVLMEMIERMGYVVQLVRVTKRVNEAYFAQLYLCKVGNETETISFDLRPSDAINMAVRCKVPIQVNKNLAYSDGMKVVEPSKLTTLAPLSDGMLFAELDSPEGEHCLDSEEFSLIQKMMNAAVEERYSDAAQWRDQLNQLRSKRKNWT